MLQKILSLDTQHLITSAVIIVVTVILAHLVRWGINHAIRRQATEANHDPTSLLFSRRISMAVVYLAGFGLALAQIPRFRDAGHSLIAGAGVITLVAGLASQQVLGNIMSGILIVIFKPFRLNDRITLNGMTGTVEDINLRQIVLRDLENNRIVVPNSMVSTNALINFNHTDVRSCKAIQIGIDYASDMDLAMAIMVDEVLRHPLHIDARTPAQIADGTPEVVARVVELGESAVGIKVWAWARDTADGFVMSCDLLKSIKQRFDREGVVIAFPQRVVTVMRESRPAHTVDANG